MIYCKNEVVASAFTFTKRVDEDRLENESWLEMRRRTEPLRQDCFTEQQANAKLIASAPDLLKELQKIQLDIKLGTIPIRKDSPIYRGIEQAINKALK
jgi:hypothetical protein